MDFLKSLYILLVLRPADPITPQEIRESFGICLLFFLAAGPQVGQQEMLEKWLFFPHEMIPGLRRALAALSPCCASHTSLSSLLYCL